MKKSETIKRELRRLQNLNKQVNRISRNHTCFQERSQFDVSYEISTSIQALHWALDLHDDRPSRYALLDDDDDLRGIVGHMQRRLRTRRTQDIKS